MNDAPSPDSAQAAPPARSAVVGLVGRANVGKSSLLNALLGEKVSIVSPVAQTTRNVVRGILTEPRGQLVFLDTPGVHKAKGDLGRVMNRSARAAADGVDIVLFVLDASVPPLDEDTGWMNRLHRIETPVVIAVNKLDRGQGHTEALRAAWAEAGRAVGTEKQAVWLATSAVDGRGLPELLAALFERAPEGPLLFPADVLTDYPRKLAVADLIREKLFGVLRDELPHAVAVWVERLDEGPEGWAVEAVVYVDKSSQKGIVIGHKGRLLRKVKRQAEAELKAVYEVPVKVELWVKVEPHWTRNFWLLKQFGYIPS